MRNAVKIFICLFMLFMGTLSVSEMAHADKATYGVYKGIVYTDYDMPEGEVKVVNYKGKKKKITIPSKIRGRKVTKVTRFEASKKVKQMHIPASVKEISLSQAPALTKVTISKKNKYFKVKGKFVVNKKGNKICSGLGGIKSVRIPNDITIIGENSFYCSSIKKLTLGKKVETIENYAFYECQKLTKVKWNKALKKIEYSAFETCNKLKNVELCETIKKIESRAFANCGSIPKIVFLHKMKMPTLEGEVFVEKKQGTDFQVGNKKMVKKLKAKLNKSGLKSFRIYVGKKLHYTNIFEQNRIFYQVKKGKAIIQDIDRTDKVLTIPEKLGKYPVTDIAWSGCSDVKSEEVHLPNSMKIVGEFAFHYNPYVKKVVLGNAVTMIELGAFEGCTALKIVEMPNSVTEIDTSSFAECKALEQIVLSKDLKKIGMAAFSDCISLKSLVFRENVKEISGDVFDGCTNLTSVEMKSNKIEFGSELFKDCTSLKKVVLPKKQDVIAFQMFSGCSSLETIVLPDSVTLIEFNSFLDCIKLKEMKIPPNVTVVDEVAFEGCSALEKIEVDSSNKTFASKDGMLMNKDKTKIIIYPPGKKDETFSCDSSIKNIGYRAFAHHGFLKKIVLNNQEIDEYAFTYMENLQTFIWKGTVTTVPAGAFLGCKKLKEVELPDTITSMGWRAFDDTGIKIFRLPKSLQNGATEAFNENKKKLPQFIIGENPYYIMKNGQLQKK